MRNNIDTLKSMTIRGKDEIKWILHTRCAKYRLNYTGFMQI